MNQYPDKHSDAPGADLDQQAGEHGMTRRQLIRHAGWFGGAVVLTIAGGEVISHVANARGAAATTAAGDSNALRFVQISDSHIGFQGPANMNVAGSFTEAINQVNSLRFRPQFVMHSGDLTHLSTAGQFDQVKEMMTGLRTERVFTVPGEHDSIGDSGRAYRRTFGRGTLGDGWYSFDTHGVHFIALVNTVNLEKLGHLGTEQIDFVRKDVAGLPSDTPIVVFSHIPLFAMYPQWGWSTDDALKVLAYLRRFSSVTCLNGHVHQLFTKSEGNITFHSATTTAYPLPKPGQGPAPVPQVVPAGRLKDALGIRTVAYRQGTEVLAVKEEKLA
ncbi:metallophosphoesterase [Streptomyces sp. NPDC046805]|uniref:metallophosphoesterase family protein n=1 Tax=Streptomyces sp. NPDC046805 TaxID=3155134 RepID=UPI0033C955B4